MRVYPSSTSAVKPGKYPYPEGYDTPQPLSPAGGGEGGSPSLYDEHVAISFRITNTGSRRGKEVAQVYISFPDDVVEENGDNIEFPAKVLRQFEKVEVKKGQSAVVDIKLTRRDLSYWSVIKQNWVMPEGKIRIKVAGSSRNVVLEGEW